jgi:hypothetical protein
MREDSGVQQLLDLEGDTKALRRGLLMEIFTGSVVAFALFCLG